MRVIVPMEELGLDGKRERERVNKMLNQRFDLGVS